MSYLLCDGIEFTLGMTVVTNNGREIKTNKEDFVVEPYHFLGKEYGILKRKDGFMGMDLNTLYSSLESRIEMQVKQLEKMKNDIDNEIALVKNGSYSILLEKAF